MGKASFLSGGHGFDEGEGGGAEGLKKVMGWGEQTTMQYPPHSTMGNPDSVFFLTFFVGTSKFKKLKILG